MVVPAPLLLPRANAGSPPMASYSKKKKKALRLAATAEFIETVAVEPVDWTTAPWFTGCESNLSACYSLLSRCFSLSDVETLNSEPLVRRAVALQKLLGRIKTELQPVEEDEESTQTTDETECTAQQILSEVVASLPSVPTGSPVTSKTVTTLEGEVVTTMTELLLCRVGRSGLATLEKWAAHLQSLLTLEKWMAHLRSLEKTVDVEKQGHDDGANDAAGGKFGPGTKILTTAMADMTTAIAFHRGPTQSADASVSVPRWKIKVWTEEIWDHFKTTHINESEEHARMAIAAQIQNTLHLVPDWARSQSQVLLLGSSLSKFGSKSSDLDMCLRLNPYGAGLDPMAAEFRLRKLRYKSRPERDYHELEGRGGNDDLFTLKEALQRSHGKVSQAQNQKKGINNRTIASQTRLSMFAAHWTALAAAVRFQLEQASNTASFASLSTSSEAFSPQLQATAAAHHALLYMQSRRLNDTEAVTTLLRRNGYRILAVARRARVPVIKFVHPTTGALCDLCLENYDGYLNSLLLRTYAECDDRARALGMAIKHWAKQRGISDAASGHLSSYTFILLTIFFLQTKAMILPNLQDPGLFHPANTVPLKLNGVDVSFCADAQYACSVHFSLYEKPWPQSVGELLLSFFEFYVEEFDFSEQVVSVRDPFSGQTKSDRWGGKTKLKAWRMSIEDPLDVNRDLADVLRFQSQFRILKEMKRALALLREGVSFEKRVCETPDDEKRAERAEGIPNQQNGSNITKKPIVPTPPVSSPVQEPVQVQSPVNGSTKSLNPKASPFTFRGVA